MAPNNVTVICSGQTNHGFRPSRRLQPLHQALHEWGQHQHSGAPTMIQPRHRRITKRSASRDLFLAGTVTDKRGPSRGWNIDVVRAALVGAVMGAKKGGGTEEAPAPVPAAASHSRLRRHKPFYPIPPKPMHIKDNWAAKPH
jgi:hypothetical protein